MIKWKALKVRRTSLRQPWHLRPFTTATWHNLTGSQLIMNASSTTKLHWCSERCKRTHWDVLREIEMTLVRFHDFSEATVPGPPTTEWLEQNRPYFQLQSYPTLSNISRHFHPRCPWTRFSTSACYWDNQNSPRKCHWAAVHCATSRHAPRNVDLGPGLRDPTPGVGWSGTLDLEKSPKITIFQRQSQSLKVQET